MARRKQAIIKNQKRGRGRPEKLIPPIRGKFEDVIKALVQPVKKTQKS